MMLPDFTAQRDALVALLERVGEVIYTAAPTGTTPRQFLILGMPEWEPPAAAVCMSRTRWGVMVVVQRDGIDDQATGAALLGLWPRVVAVLDDATEADPSLGGVCVTSKVSRADFGSVTLNGRDLPAQIITLELEGN